MTTVLNLIQTTTLPSGELETLNGKLHYIKLHIEESDSTTTVVGNMWLTWVGSVFDSLEKHMNI